LLNFTAENIFILYNSSSGKKGMKGKMVFAKLIFFPQNFFLLRKISLFQNTKKVLAGKKST
jgi:hypothetical protein